MKINKLVLLALPLLMVSCGNGEDQSFSETSINGIDIKLTDFDISKMEKIDPIAAKEKILREAEENKSFDNVCFEVYRNGKNSGTTKEIIYQDKDTLYRGSEFEISKNNGHMHTFNSSLQEIDSEYNFTAKFKEDLFPDNDAYFYDCKFDITGLFKISSEQISQESVNEIRKTSFYNASYLDFLIEKTPLDAYKNSNGDIILGMADGFQGNDCLLLFNNGKLMSYYSMYPVWMDEGFITANFKYNVEKPYLDSSFDDVTYQRDNDLIVGKYGYYIILN